MWGERWIRELITDDDVDPARIMWDMGRMLDSERMPAERVVVHFEFVGVPQDKVHFWLVLDRDQADLCVIDPGFGDDLLVRSRPGTIGTMWVGDRRTPRSYSAGWQRWCRLLRVAPDSPKMSNRPIDGGRQ